MLPPSDPEKSSVYTVIIHRSTSKKIIWRNTLKAIQTNQDRVLKKRKRRLREEQGTEKTNNKMADLSSTISKYKSSKETY
jgi:hypothetical protein